MKKLTKALALSLIMLGTSACATHKEENGSGIIKSITTDQEGNMSISIMDQEGEVNEYNIASVLANRLNEGDKIEYRIDGESMVGFTKTNYSQTVTLSNIYSSLSDMIGKDGNVSIFSAKEFTDNYGMEESNYKDGVAIMSNTSGDIRTVIIIETDDPLQFQQLFTEIVDGLRATYQDSPELLEKLEEPYMRFEKGHAVLIVGDETLRQDVLSEMEACETWAN